MPLPVGSLEGMRLQIPELLKEHNMTAYGLAKASQGRITQSMAIVCRTVNSAINGH